MIKAFNTFRMILAGVVFGLIFPELLFRSVLERRERLDRLRNPHRWTGK